jgi:hypothetical protein
MRRSNEPAGSRPRRGRPRRVAEAITGAGDGMKLATQRTVQRCAYSFDEHTNIKHVMSDITDNADKA